MTSGCEVQGAVTDGPIPPDSSLSYSGGMFWDHGDAHHMQLLVPLHPISDLALLRLANPRARRQEIQLGPKLDCVEAF